MNGRQLCVLVFGCALACVAADEVGLVEGGGPESFEPIPARGITIEEIELNQGTRVAIGAGGEWIAESERSTPLIGSRDSLLRVHHEVDPGWVPREIEARLWLAYPDGTSEELSQRLVIEGGSSRDAIASGFAFELDGPRQAQPGTEYRVELWEIEAGGEGLPELDWANPAAGSEAIGFLPTPLSIEVVLVPIHFAQLDTIPALDEPTIARFVDSLYEHNPTAEVDWQLHDPVVYEDNLVDLGQLLPFLSQLKSQEGAAANVYYHALVDVQGPSLAGIRGIGNIAGEGEGEGNLRVAATIFWPGNLDESIATFTHEHGHNQGLAHVACPGLDADGVEDGYPHVDGQIGAWGWAVRAAELYAPDVFDYMSYCAPTWVSDWTWAKTYARIATLSAWGEAEPAMPDELLLIGALHPSGREQWWTVPGKLDPSRRSDEAQLRLLTKAGVELEAGAELRRLSDDASVWILAELPVPLEQLDTIEHRRGDRRALVDPRALVDHRARSH